MRLVVERTGVDKPMTSVVSIARPSNGHFAQVGSVVNAKSGAPPRAELPVQVALVVDMNEEIDTPYIVIPWRTQGDPGARTKVTQRRTARAGTCAGTDGECGT